MSCQTNNPLRLPDYLVNIMLDNLRNAAANPSGIWRDFNCIYNNILTYQDFMVGLSNKGLICNEDLPEFPNPEDYQDLVDGHTFEDCICSHAPRPR